MSCGHCRIPRTLILLSLAVGFPVSTCAGEMRSTNIRPFFGVGYTRPLGFGDYNRGFGLAAGLEMEESSLLSAVVRVDWSNQETADAAAPTVYYNSSMTRL